MRSWNRAKMGMQVVEAVALTCAFAACGSGARRGVAQGQGSGTADGGNGLPGGDVDGASPCSATSCHSADAAVPADDSGSLEAEAGPVFDGDPAAVFVATTGVDSAPGTMAKPVQSITKGVALAQHAHKDLYVCNGTYAEAVVIANAAVSVHGGYDCTSGWARVDDRPTIAPSSGVPLTVQGISTAMTVERLQLQASDASSDGDSSIAAIAVSSSGLKFNQVIFQAGVGAPGKPGASPQPIATPNISGAPGFSFEQQPDCKAGNTSGYCSEVGAGGHTAWPAGMCGDWSLGAGGAGGNGGNFNTGKVATSGANGGPTHGGGTGGVIYGAIATDGQPGSPGAAGSASTNGVGTFSASGYTPANAGGAGKNGAVGGGGGGGTGGWSADDQLGDGIYCGYSYLGGGGGEGGYGGCGGAGGGGGGGGGASIGLLAVDATVTLSSCQVNTSAGGGGGQPGKGADGQEGGGPGTGGNGTHGGGPPGSCGQSGVGNAAPGGSGARGGHGGPGGPGGGGPSIGIVALGGPQPDTTTVDFNIAPGGAGGPALSGTNGADGLSTQVLATGTSDGGVAHD